MSQDRFFFDDSNWSTSATITNSLTREEWDDVNAEHPSGPLGEYWETGTYTVRETGKMALFIPGAESLSDVRFYDDTGRYISCIFPASVLKSPGGVTIVREPFSGSASILS